VSHGVPDNPAAAGPSPVVITVESAGQCRFRATLNSPTVIKGSRTAFFDAARILIAKRCNPAATLIMRHTYSATDALVAKIGAAAGLMIREDRGAPEFVFYHKLPRKHDAGPDRVAQNDTPTILLASDAIDAPWPPRRRSGGAT
jgi:hypothetical protein